MKAIEYADLYREDLSDPKKALDKVFFGLIHEMQALIKQRNIKTDQGLHGVVKEIINKWKAFVRIINADGPVLNPDGFEAVLESHVGLKVTPTGIIDIRTVQI